MKKLNLIILAIAVLLLPAFAAADETLSGKTFYTTSNGILYEIAFFQGPFGPGETGSVELSDLSGNSYAFGYVFKNPVCQIHSLIFILIENQLKNWPTEDFENTLTFTEGQAGGD